MSKIHTWPLTENLPDTVRAIPTEPRKPYRKPRIELELKLETRAGTPLSVRPRDDELLGLPPK